MSTYIIQLGNVKREGNPIIYQNKTKNSTFFMQPSDWSISPLITMSTHLEKKNYNNNDNNILMQDPVIVEYIAQYIADVQQ
ncbi:21708_t:CDS:2 [Entrophospora sp. SA101]|nr:21708_t:CDS:2 [Entrophospora sp. SA101]